MRYKNVIECFSWMLWMIICLHLEFSNSSSLSQRHTAFIEGNILVGVLFPIHRQPRIKDSYTRTCGEVWEEYGIHRTEVTLRTIDRINANPNILPGIRLGVEIRDSCWFSSVALEQSIEFIRDAIAKYDEKKPNETNDCQERPLKNIAGVIGPGSSTVTIPVQNLFQLFNIPQIGYSATSQKLSDKNVYKYFLRVVPSDYFQAQVMIDIVKKYKWTYVSAVHTEGAYGGSGMEAFKKLAAQEEICIASSSKVRSNDELSAFQEVVRTLNASAKARVVVCFCEGATIRGILRAMRSLKMVGYFTLIGSDGWADRRDVVENLEVEAQSGISIRIHSEYIDGFDEYFFGLKPFQNKRNPWWEEFWQQRFNCYFDKSKAVLGKKKCTGNEDLSIDYKQDTKLGFVIKAINAMAYGLHDMHQEVCKGVPGLCKEMNPLDGRILLSYLMDVNTTGERETQQLSFDENGDPPGRYDILNYQRLDNGKFGYVQIGTWDSGDLYINDSITIWNKQPDLTLPVSVCSFPCPRGQVKTIQDGGVSCCWVCTECKPNEYLLDEFRCQPCPRGWWPNENLTACNRITVEYIQWSDVTSIVVVCLAAVGIIAAFFTLVVFIKFNETAMVKATTRELSYVIIVGFFLCYISSFILIAKPVQWLCYLGRILPGLGFSMIYGSLVTKTNRIARILAGSKKKIMTRKPRFMSATAQVVITWILVGLEIAIIITMLLLEPADAIYDYPSPQRVQLICNTSTLGVLAPLGFDFFLVGMCTVYAVKTRNVPGNFNEAKFIGFTMYTTCIVWLAFVPIYFGSDMKVITMCVCISLSATVALILLFAPKLYIIVLHPERNNRAAFTTAKNVRCHIGSSHAASKPNYTGSVQGGSLDDERSPDNSALVDQRKFQKHSDAKKSAFWKRITKKNNGVTQQKKPPASVPMYRPTLKREDSIHVEADQLPGRFKKNAKASEKPDSDLEEFDKEVLQKAVNHNSIETGKERPIMKDISSQTSDELLEALIPGLRRRNVGNQNKGAYNGQKPFQLDNSLPKLLVKDNQNGAKKYVNANESMNDDICDGADLSPDEPSDISPLLEIQKPVMFENSELTSEKRKEEPIKPSLDSALEHTLLLPVGLTKSLISHDTDAREHSSSDEDLLTGEELQEPLVISEEPHLIDFTPKPQCPIVSSTSAPNGWRSPLPVQPITAGASTSSGDRRSSLPKITGNSDKQIDDAQIENPPVPPSATSDSIERFQIALRESGIAVDLDHVATSDV